MKRSAALLSIALTFGAITLAPCASTQAQASRQEGPIEIEKCRTIDKPGSYKLVNNLTFTGTTGTCLSITASFVTIDLAGFTISGPAPGPTAIAVGDNTTGIAIRNGSISGFSFGVNLGGSGSIVEGLRVIGTFSGGISANGIVRGNIVAHVISHIAFGINASGTITDNYVTGVDFGPGIFAEGTGGGNTVRGNTVTDSGFGIQVSAGSTVIGNTAVNSHGFGGEAGFGIAVSCPSNVTDNTAVNNEGNNKGQNLVLNGNGCNNTNNVAP